MNIIFINGPSSSGKTTIARTLQDLLDRFYLHIGIDTFIHMMPARANNLTANVGAAEGFFFEPCTVDEKTAFRVRSGHFGQLVNEAYRETVKVIAQRGIGVIVDDVIDGISEWKKWQPYLDGLTLIKIAVSCDEEVLAHRERERGDRRIGSAIEQSRRVHQGMDYDLQVDTSFKSAEQCARYIAKHIIRVE